jgi:hypothetical protein
MQCHDAANLLALYAVNGLEVEVAHEVEQHVLHCEPCRQRLAPLETACRDLRAADMTLPSPTDAWLVAGSSARRRARHRRLVRITGAAAALLVIVGLAVVLGVRVRWSSNALVVAFGAPEAAGPVTLEQVAAGLDRLALGLERQAVQHQRDLLWLARAFDEARSEDLQALRTLDLVGTWPVQSPEAVLVAQPVSSSELPAVPAGNRVLKKLKP